MMEGTATPEKLQEYLAKKNEKQLTAAALIEFLHGELVTDRMQRKYDELIRIGTLDGQDLDNDKHNLICNTMASIGLEAVRFLELGQPQNLVSFPGKSKEEIEEIFHKAQLLQRFFNSSFAKI